MGMTRSVIAACIMVTGAGAAAASAGDIARCVGDHGEPMFAQHCGTQMRAARNTTLDSSWRAPAQSKPAAWRGALASSACARSPQQLAEHVQAAMHARNGVRLSGYVLWRGRSGSGVRADVRALLQVLRSGIADVQLRWRDDAYGDSPTDERAPRRDEYALVVATLSGQGESLRSGERWFGVEREHGCYWLTLAPPARWGEASPYAQLQADAAVIGNTP